MKNLASWKHRHAEEPSRENNGGGGLAGQDLALSCSSSVLLRLLRISGYIRQHWIIIEGCKQGSHMVRFVSSVR